MVLPHGLLNERWCWCQEIALNHSFHLISQTSESSENWESYGQNSDVVTWPNKSKVRGMIPGFMESCPGLCPCLCTATQTLSEALSSSTFLSPLFSHQPREYYISFKSPNQGEYSGALDKGQYWVLCPLQPLQLCCVHPVDTSLAPNKTVISFLLLLLLASMWYQ